MKFSYLVCGILPLVGVSCADLAINPRYVKRHEPVVTRGERGCDSKFDLRSKRGVIDLWHTGLSGSRAGSCQVRLVNHGKEFKVSSRSDNGWTTIEEGKAVEIEIPRSDTGFQVSNQLSGNGTRIGEPINATITFLGLPCQMAEKQLIEGRSGL